MAASVRSQSNPNETLNQITARLASETDSAYAACPFSALSRDYFSRFHRNPSAKPEKGEIAIDQTWKILLPPNPLPMSRLMAKHLAEFLAQRMMLHLDVIPPATSAKAASNKKRIMLSESGGGDPAVSESFSIDAEPGRIAVCGQNPEGLRDGIVRLVDLFGFRGAPFLPMGKQNYAPRLRVRLGVTPKFGSYKDAVFLGYNAVFIGGGSLFELSASNAIPELKTRRVKGLLQSSVDAAQKAREYGLKTYSFINTRQKFSGNDPVFQTHPEIRGALTWKADGDYVLCSEHPLVRQYLCESVRGLFEADPQLDGIVIIVGGEGFYHCFMRPYGVQKGHTNCPRCELIGAEQVVANLCNALATAAREINPRAEIVAWLYSAEHVWSADRAQEGFIRNLTPGTAVFTEIEKDEYQLKPDGVRKHFWDYSIDLIGPGERARKQVEVCADVNIPIYMKSEPELAFEAPRLPHVPCMDRWVDRAEALAACGATGAWVFPAFRSNFGTSASEVYKFLWWTPVAEKERLLQQFAARIAGETAGPHLRRAWQFVSQAIEWSPELPSYYTGPYYLGPAQPMCANPQAALPDVFYGRYLFHAEITDADGLKLEPTFVTSPTGNVPVFGRFYRKMAHLLKQAADELAAARALVPEHCRLTFSAEDSPIRWFYHTARTEANFYESCQLRDSLLAFAATPDHSEDELTQMQSHYDRWKEVLSDELENAREALPVMEHDMRLDFYYGSDHTFSHGTDMIKAKIDLLETEINVFLPEVARKCGLMN